MRRLKELEDKFLIKDELKRKEKWVQDDITNKFQRFKIKTELNTKHAKKESVNWMTAILIKDETEEREEENRNRSQDKEIDKLQVKQTLNVSSEHQIEIERLIKISKAMTISFYETTEQEDLHQRFLTRTSADVRS